MTLALAALLLLHELAPCRAAAPLGTIAAIASHTRHVGAQIALSYLEPVNCTLQFDQDVEQLTSASFNTTPGTEILHFAGSGPTYTFQLAADTNANVTVFLLPGAVPNQQGEYNNVTTGYFSFLFYAYPPAATLRLDGYVAQSTGKLSNLAYLMFNSTTEYNGTAYFDESSLSLSNGLAVTNFARVSDVMFSFNFEILKNDTAESSSQECAEPDSGVPGPGYTKFRCSLCPRSQYCMSWTSLPPAGIEYLEFPFEVVIAAIPELGLAQSSPLPFVYDTLWPEVVLDAPVYAKGPFFATIAWSEALADVTAVQPVFGAVGPAVSQEALAQNLTILNSSAFKVLVHPVSTGILTININGTSESMDLAGNKNDFRLRSFTKTGSQKTVIYSGGPPIEGALSFQYFRPPSVYEYRTTVDMLGVPSLAISWQGFTTATRYDLWAEWGENSSWTLATDTVDSTLNIGEFHALLGLEYRFYLRAYNNFGDAITISKIFLHPKISVVADGTYKMIHLPDFLSAQKTNVTFYAIVKENTFLSFNPLKALSFRTIDRQGGDVEPCDQNSHVLRCTLLNFHVEVPDTQFIVFREPVRLQFTWGRRGWREDFFRPQLRYWEDYHEEWRVASESCPPHNQYEHWNDLHKVYSVQICHLSQFAIFEFFSPPPATTTSPPPPRPDSNVDPMFFLIGGLLVLGCICACGCCVLVYKRPWKDREVVFSDPGFRSVKDRLPARRPKGPSANAVRNFQPSSDSDAEHVPALRDKQPATDMFALGDAVGVVPGGLPDSPRGGPVVVPGGLPDTPRDGK